MHRLVAMAFLPNIEEKQEVDHLNCIRDDNRVENLCWVTHCENCNNPITRKNYSVSSSKRNFVISEETRKKILQTKRSRPNPLKGIARPIEVRLKIAKSKNKKVAQYSLEGIFLKEWESIQAAAEGTGISKDSISEIANGKRSKARKFMWKFV